MKLLDEYLDKIVRRQLCFSSYYSSHVEATIFIWEYFKKFSLEIWYLSIFILFVYVSFQFYQSLKRISKIFEYQLISSFGCILDGVLERNSCECANHDSKLIHCAVEDSSILPIFWWHTFESQNETSVYIKVLLLSKIPLERAKRNWLT